MKEVYKCKCGNTSWTIHGGTIECNACGLCICLISLFSAEQNVFLESPEDFNSKMKMKGGEENV